ncbi:MAG: LamG domain-containing protein [Patescibacteria group bacterium]
MKKILFLLLIFITLTCRSQHMNPNLINWDIPVTSTITADGFSEQPYVLGVTGLTLEAINSNYYASLGISGTITAITQYNRNEDDVFSPDDPKRYWYKKKDSSWWQEKQEDFPERVLIVCATSLYIIDLDTQTVWMQFDRGAGHHFVATSTITGVSIKNGVMLLCLVDSGIYSVFFPDDRMGILNTTGQYLVDKNIENRNTSRTATLITGYSPIISVNCNAIHLNVVEGTLYTLVGTNDGLSQINMSTGVVWDVISSGVSGIDTINNVFLDSTGKIYFTSLYGNASYYRELWVRALLTADVGNYTTDLIARYKGDASASSLIDNTVNFNCFSFDVLENQSLSDRGQGLVVCGNETKLTILHENSTPSSAWYQYITKTYNTGILYGDTDAVGCYLNGSDSVVADRTYRGNTLTNEGTVIISADSTAPYGVSASFNGSNQYLWSDDSDFDASVTDKLVISFWLSTDTSIASSFIVSKYNGSTSNKSYLIFKSNTSLIFYVSTDGSTTTSRTCAVAISTGLMYHFVCVFDGTNLDIYANGVKSNGALSGAIPANLFSSNANFAIGSEATGGSYFNGKISQVKVFNALPADIATYAKTEYETGRNTIGNNCLIQGNSTQVNSVSAYDNLVLLSSGDSVNSGMVQTFSGGSVGLTISATTNANNIVSLKKDYGVFSSNTASVLQIQRNYIDFLKYIQNLVYKPKETIFIKGTWASAGSSITITNSYITKNSNIIAMPLSAPEGSWYLSDQAEGTVNINSLSTEAYSVDYLLMINN